MTAPPAGTSTSFMRRAWLRLIPVIGMVALMLLAVPMTVAAPGDIGFEGHAGPGGAPSGSKPESKLWFNDGQWWASMYDATTLDAYIWKLNASTHTWTRTSTRIDDRSNTRADTLWDASTNKLYVATHIFNETDGTGTARLLRFSYNTSSDTYTLDSGFPATITTQRSETLVIAKDSTGQLWATWEANGTIWVNRTTGADNQWGSAFAMPGAAAVNTDDISSIIAFGGNKVGVMWSNQNASPDAFFFAIHNDTAGDTTWTTETAYSGSNVADDHINLKTDSSGRVFAAIKTSLTGSNRLIGLLARGASGGWTNHTVSLGTQGQTRPIVVVDEVNSLLRVFVTSEENGGTINEHDSPLGSISFPGGAGTVVMQDASSLDMNNVSGSKQNATSATGLVLIAYEDTPRLYWHAELAAPAPPSNTPPTANATSASTTTSTPVQVSLSGTDAQSCDLTFSIVAPPSQGSLGTITNAACTTGSPNTDAASVIYTPNPGYTGPDSFTYKVNDGSADSAPATASLTVSPGSGGGGTVTEDATEDAQVRSSTPTSNFGSISTIRIGGEGTTTTYRSYVEFDVSGLSGTVSSVKLRLFATDASPNIVHVFGTSSSWTEGTINWDNKPALGAELGSAPVPTLNAYNEITLSPSAVTGNGIVSFGLTIDGSNSAIFSSSEGANAPQLVVTTSGPPSDTTAPSRGATSVNGSALTIAYDEALDTGSVPATSAFTVSVNGTGRPVSNVGISGSTVTLTLSSPVVSSDTVLASYTAGTSPIQDVAGNDAVNFTDAAVTNNTPPADTTAPARTSAAVNGSTLTIGYDEALATSPLPATGDFTVNVGASSRTVTNVAISGSTVTLTLASPVISADTVTLSYTAGTNPIQDLAGNDAANFDAAPVTNNTPAGDTTPPTRGTPAVNGSTLTIPYDEALDTGSVPSNADFAVTVNSSNRDVSNVAIAGSTVTLTLTSPVISSDTVVVSYVKGANPIQDVAGNDAANFTDLTATNNTPPGDTTAPVRGATAINGGSLTIAYNEALDTGSIPAATAFTVNVNGTGRAVSNVGISGSTVTLTLSSPVVSTNSVTVSYVLPATNRIQDVAGNDAAAFSDAAVTNNTPPSGGGTVTENATEDAQVRSSTPTQNWSEFTTIRVGGEGTTTIYRSYVKFDVSGLSGTVSSVKLRLYATDASPNIVHVYSTSNSWTEATLNWSNMPAQGTERGSGPVPTLNAYNEITLDPSSVTGNGEVSFLLTIDGTNSAIFSSSEGANAPQLVITTS